MTTRRAVPLVVLAGLLGALAGCGGSDGGATGTTTSTIAPTTLSDGAQPTATTGSQGVPDACELTDPAELGAILGADLGAGRPVRVSPDRSTCMYANGTITAVELAANYEASRSIIDGQGRKTEDVPGIGSAAFYDPAGQLVAKGDTVFVAVTAAGVSTDKLKAAAQKLLDAAE